MPIESHYTRNAVDLLAFDGYEGVPYGRVPGLARAPGPHGDLNGLLGPLLRVRGRVGGAPQVHIRGLLVVVLVNFDCYFPLWQRLLLLIVNLIVNFDCYFPLCHRNTKNNVKVLLCVLGQCHLLHLMYI